VDTDDTTAPSTFAPRVEASTFGGLGRLGFTTGVAGIIAGVLVAGFGGRVFMRFAGAVGGASAARRTTEAGFTVGELTIGGTIALVVFIGLAAGLVGAVTHVAMRPWLAWAGPFRGAVYGVALFGLASASSDLMNPDNIDFRLLGHGPLLVGGIVCLFLLFGLVLEWGLRVLEKRLPEDEPNSQATILYLVLSSLGALASIPLTMFIFFSVDSCSCDPPVGASWSFVVVFVATIVLWVGVVIALPLWLKRSTTFAGYLGMIGIAAFGLVRAVSDAIDIIRLG